jgi:hypothetical protein
MVNMLRFSVISWSSLSYLHASGLQYTKLGLFMQFSFHVQVFLGSLRQPSLCTYQGIGGVNATFISPGFNRN